MLGTRNANVIRPSRMTKVVLLSLALALLVACRSRPVYDETPTVEPYVAPSAISTPAATATPIPTPTQTPTPVVSGPTKLYIEPSAILGLPVGETSQVEVWLKNVERLHDIELHISFEPRYVHIEDADPDEEGVQIKAGDMPVPVQVIQNEANNYAGVIIYHVTAESPASGGGIVASFTVRGQAEGGTPLRFTVVKLLDPKGQEVVVEDEIDGLVSVSAGGVASEPTEAPPVATPPVVSGVEPTPVPPTPSSSAVYHTVQAGENLYRIALRYGTTVNAIVAANNLPNRNSVRVGQVLLIPVGASAGTVTYVVQPGDTLHSIARRFGTTVDALAAHNGIAPPYTIKVGQTLVIVP